MTYFTTGAQTADQSFAHGHPTLPSSEGWEHNYIYKHPCANCVNRWSSDNLDGCAEIGAVQYTPIRETGADCQSQNPNYLLDFYRKFQNWLQYLYYIAVLQPAINTKYNGENTINYSDSWELYVTASTSTSITVRNLESSPYRDPWKLPLASDPSTYATCIQPGDIITKGARTDWELPLKAAQVVRVSSASSNSTTIEINKDIKCPNNEGVVLWGERGDAPTWWFPQPHTTSNPRLCKYCLIDYSGTLSAVKSRLTSSNKAYYGIGEYDGLTWFCGKWDTADKIKFFNPGLCAIEECSGFVESDAFPLEGFRYILSSNNTYLVHQDPSSTDPSAYKWGRPNNSCPSLGFLAGQKIYDSQNYANKKKVWWHGRGDYGEVTHFDSDDAGLIGRFDDTSKEVIQDLFDENNTGTFLNLNNRQSFVGGTLSNSAFRNTDLKNITIQSPSKKWPTVYATGYTNTPQDPYEYPSQRAQKLSRTFPEIDTSYYKLVEHPQGSVTIHDSPKTVYGVALSKATITINKGTTYSKTFSDSYANTLGANASVDGTNKVMKLQVKPGVVTLADAGSDPVTDPDDEYYRVVSGNAVDAPEWYRPNNPYCSRSYSGDVFNKIQEGDTIVFDNYPDWQFTVLRAEAHAGDTFSGDSTDFDDPEGNPVDPSLDPKGDTPGLPGTSVGGDLWYNSNFRLTMDTVWVEFDSDIATEIITTPNKGDTFTVYTKPTFVPKRYWNGSSWSLNGYQGYPEVKIKYPFVEGSTTLTENSEYVIDRSTGVIEILTSAFSNHTITSGFCAVIDGYYLVRRDELQAEAIDEYISAIKQINGRKCALSYDDKQLIIGANGNFSHIDGHYFVHVNVFNDEPDPDETTPAWNKTLNNPVSTIYSPTDAGSQETDPDVRNSYNVEYSVTDPPVTTPIYRLGIPTVISSESYGEWKPRYHEEFEVALLNDSLSLAGIPGNLIKEAYIDITVPYVVGHDITISKPSGVAYNGTTHRTETETTGVANLSVSTAVVNGNTGTVTLIDDSCKNGNTPTEITQGDTISLEITQAAKLLADRSLVSSEYIILLIRGGFANGLTSSTLSFNDLFYTWCDYQNVTYNGATILTATSTALDFHFMYVDIQDVSVGNLRLKLDIDKIDDETIEIANIVPSNRLGASKTDSRHFPYPFEEF